MEESGQQIPHHITIIMDGNGRWARERRLPRIEGHRRGAEAVRSVVRGCAEIGVEALTLFAFSTENWRRPPSEVNALMGLFRILLEREGKALEEQGVRFRVIGDRQGLGESVVQGIEAVEQATANNSRLTLSIAANYGGRWDIARVARELAQEVTSRERDPKSITEETIYSRLALANLPEPDLFIRTGGEQRISNFLIWQLAYTELYFTNTLWPDFGHAALEDAIESFNRRQRRFGRTGEQSQE